MAKTREDLLALAKRRYVEVDGFRLQSLTELELSNLQSLWTERYSKSKTIDMRMRRELIAVCLVDDEGKRLFQNDEVSLLGEIDASVVNHLYSEARKHNRMDEGSDEVESYEKKSDETQS